MKKIKIVQGVLVLWIALHLGACSAAAPINAASAEYSQLAAPAADQQDARAGILRATVQIHVYRFSDDAADHLDLTAGEAQELIEQNAIHSIARGQGTLVTTPNGLRIITHDYWGEMVERGDMLQDADLVQFLDAWNQPLQTISGLEFTQSILYRDQGTLVLAAPAGIDLTPANLGESRQVLPGEFVWVTHQKANGEVGLEVVQAVVESAETLMGLPAWKLKLDSDCFLMEEDAGGGIWHDGLVVGNVWAAELAHTPTQEQSSGLLSQNAPVLFVAARFPLQVLLATPAAVPERAPSLTTGKVE